MHGQTGNWEERLIDYTVFNTRFAAGAVMLFCVCGALISISYLWRKHLKDMMSQLQIQFNAAAIHLWYSTVRNPVSWLVQPVRRAHARWSAKNLRETMAKWRKGHLANAFYETIHQQIQAGMMSPQQGKQLQEKMAKFFGLDDLARIKTHAEAIRHRLALNKISDIGPVINQDSGLGGTKPCWGDEPQPYGPPVETLGGNFLNRKKVA